MVAMSVTVAGDALCLARQWAVDPTPPALGTLVLLTAGYVAAVALVARGAARQTAAGWWSAEMLRPALCVYNAYQIAVNACALVGLLPPVLLPPPRNDGRAMRVFWLRAHYHNKYVDWLDTLFIVLRGGAAARQLSGLHVYHHAVMPFCWWAALRWGATRGPL